MHPHQPPTDWGFAARHPLGGLAGRLQHAARLAVPDAAPPDVRAAVLVLLAEAPMHGAQIIGELTERSGGAWQPTAGAIYPTLQLLVDEGLAQPEAEAGKKVYRLTEAGRAAASGLADGPAPWERAGARGPLGGGLRRATAGVVQAALQIGRLGTPAQAAAAAGVLDEARKKLYALLAEG